MVLFTKKALVVIEDGPRKAKARVGRINEIRRSVASSAISPDLRAFRASCSSRKGTTVNLAFGPSTATATALQISTSKAT